MNQQERFSKELGEITQRSEVELSGGETLRTLLKESIGDFGRKWDVHLPVFLTAPSLARLLWLNLVYQKALEIPGSLIEFGSQWGASMNVFMLLKLIHEPWNISRKIISFSTFSDGFVSLDEKDGVHTNKGDYAVKESWQDMLKLIMTEHAARSPLGAMNNFDIIEGDVSVTFERWLLENPEALISHVHFDMDVYKPTKDALQLCLSRMPRGSILIFDELNCPSFPGETLAVQEVLGIQGLALRKSQYQPYSTYCIIE